MHTENIRDRYHHGSSDRSTICSKLTPEGCPNIETNMLQIVWLLLFRRFRNLASFLISHPGQSPLQFNKIELNGIRFHISAFTPNEPQPECLHTFQLNLIQHKGIVTLRNWHFVDSHRKLIKLFVGESDHGLHIRNTLNDSHRFHEGLIRYDPTNPKRSNKIIIHGSNSIPIESATKEFHKNQSKKEAKAYWEGFHRRRFNAKLYTERGIKDTLPSQYTVVCLKSLSI
jgi:hypothetical protein